MDLHDIQRGVLSGRPSPYAATYLLFRVDDPAHGRELIRHCAGVVTSAADTPLGHTWISVALTHEGLKALGVPQHSLESMAWEFQQGMAARAGALGDVGPSAPQHWEAPLGSPDVHVVLVALAPDQQRLQVAIDRARPAYEHLPGITAIWRQDCYALPTETEHFGYRDGISHPAVDGSNVPASNPLEKPLAAGEFVLGYPDELGGTQVTDPPVLGRNGSYVAFRKLHQDVAAFRRLLAAETTDAAGRELLAAKLMGRWRSGAPLALAPEHDDPVLGADRQRNNAFGYADDDPDGFVTPGSCHIRRANPRDSAVAGEVRLHRMIRRGTAYGPPLPDGTLDDDGVDRGLMFAFVGAHLGRQFEFAQTQWLNDGVAFGCGDARDPIAATGDGPGDYTIPQRPVRRKLHDLPLFVTTRGGEYAFLPSISALRWLARPTD
ncbi:Dyp-type peroxidase [Actinoplanes regularis]|uniref:Dyp-type peroxidase family n=1 Tax=Actinoplanes regularis TaxID=52697 RepID=A0A239BM56_9ACTN|nr:Dyp-type peroxidase [Actinoplanes regularis]GIE88401.1 peroxidase [Actinoplanes regularis]SNS09267.1 Dyp-type peroxidase family [Actinoplanes regularis]